MAAAALLPQRGCCWCQVREMLARHEQRCRRVRRGSVEKGAIDAEDIIRCGRCTVVRRRAGSRYRSSSDMHGVDDCQMQDVHPRHGRHGDALSYYLLYSSMREEASGTGTASKMRCAQMRARRRREASVKRSEQKIS